MIRTRIISILLSTALLTSSIVGTDVLVTDGYLWGTAPLHALGLFAFTVASAALTFGVWKLRKYSVYARYGLPGIALFAIVQLVAMLGDTIAGAPSGVSQIVFRDYLLGDAAFVTLIVIQPLVAAAALAASRTAFPYDSSSLRSRSR